MSGTVLGNVAAMQRIEKSKDRFTDPLGARARIDYPITPGREVRHLLQSPILLAFLLACHIWPGIIHLLGIF